MSKGPALRVKKEAWKSTFEVQDFERARDFPFGAETIIVVEGRQINSYEDLVKLVTEERFKNKRSLDVLFVPMIAGG